jgi:primosomal protein N' (replication factor Y)
MRRIQNFPPFSDLFSLRVSGPDEAAVLRVCMNLRVGLEGFHPLKGETAEVIGPAPAAVLKVNDRYRYQLILRTRNTGACRRHLAELLRLAQGDPATRGIAITAELNAMDN